MQNYFININLIMLKEIIIHLNIQQKLYFYFKLVLLLKIQDII